MLCVELSDQVMRSALFDCFREEPVSIAGKYSGGAHAEDLESTAITLKTCRPSRLLEEGYGGAAGPGSI